MQELKSLLVEAAFRNLLNTEAADVLAEQAENLLNRDGSFHLFFMNLTWF